VLKKILKIGVGQLTSLLLSDKLDARQVLLTAFIATRELGTVNRVNFIYL